jgi:hypothetical protein
MFNFILKNNPYLKPEIVHYYDCEYKDLILSHCNKFYIKIKGSEHFFHIDLRWYLCIFSQFRILRRLLRLDKSNVTLNYNKNGVVIIYKIII